MFPLWLLGCLIAIGGSCGAIVGTTIQKISFRKNDGLHARAVTLNCSAPRAYIDAHPVSALASPLCASLALPLSQRRVYWRQGLWLGGLALVGVGGVTDFVSLALAPQSTIAALGSLPLAANVGLAHFWLRERVSKRDFGGTFLIVAGSTLSVVFGDHSDKTYTSDELQDLYAQTAYIAYGALMLVSLFLMYSLIRWRLTPLRVALVEAIDAFNVAGVEEDMTRAEEEALEAWAIVDAEGQLLNAEELDAGGGAQAATSPLHAKILQSAQEDEADDDDGTGAEVAAAAARAGDDVRITLLAANGKKGSSAESGPLPSTASKAAPAAPLPCSLVADDGSMPFLAKEDGSASPSDQEPPSPILSAPMILARSRVQNLERSYSPWKRVHPVFYCALSGIFGAQSLLFGKSVSSLVATSFSDDGTNQFLSVLTYAFILALGVCLVGQLHFFATALEFFDALFVVPVFKCFFLTLSTFGGALYFREFEEFTTKQWVLFPLGMGLNVIGVWVLSTRNMKVGKQKDALDELRSEDGSSSGDSESDSDDDDDEVAAAAGSGSDGEFASHTGYNSDYSVTGSAVPTRPSSRRPSHRLESIDVDLLSPAARHEDNGGRSTSNAAERAARRLEKAQESLVRSAVEIANEELVLHHRSASSAEPTPASSRSSSVPRGAALAAPGERVLLVTSPVEGVVLVAEEVVGGRDHAAAAAQLTRQPTLHLATAARGGATPVRTSSGGGAAAGVTTSWISPEPLLAGAHPSASSSVAGGPGHLAVDVQEGSRAHMALSPTPTAAGGASVFATSSLLADGSTMQPVNVFSMPAPSTNLSSLTSPEMRERRAAAAAAAAAGPASMSYGAMRRTTSEQPQSGLSRGRSTSGNDLRSLTSRSLLPPASPSSSLSTSSRRSHRRRTNPHPDILVQRGSHIYRQPSFSAKTPLDSSRSSATANNQPTSSSSSSSGGGTGGGGGTDRVAPHLPSALAAFAGEHQASNVIDARSSSSSVVASGVGSVNSGSSGGGGGLGWDVVPLYLTPAQSSSFTVSSPWTREQYSMPREQSIFAHTRQYLARLGSATNLFRQTGTPSASVSGRSRSAMSPSSFGGGTPGAYTAPPVRPVPVPSSAIPPAPFSAMGPNSYVAAMEDEQAWRQAREHIARTTAAGGAPMNIPRPTPTGSTPSAAGSATSAASSQVPSYVPPPFMKQPLAQPQPPPENK